MRALRWALLAAVIGQIGLLGCGRKTRTTRHPGSADTATVLAPTPDTTPIAPLRTPAGLVLKAGPEATATPSAETVSSAPASAKAAS
jgi:hypothetical protein